MQDDTAKNPLLLPLIVFSSLIVSLFAPGSVRLGSQSTALSASRLPSAAFANQPVISTKLRAFIQRVINGNAKQVVGIYADDEFAYPVIQQPPNHSMFVSNDPDQVTQYRLPAIFGTVALLAHNNLAGSDFGKLQLGSTFTLVYGNGGIKQYQVSDIRQYRALDPDNPFSDFVDVQSPGAELTSADLFDQVYTRPGEVVFQTCIDRDGDPSWGRMFISAQPVPDQPSYPQAYLQLAAAY